MRILAVVLLAVAIAGAPAAPQNAQATAGVCVRCGWKPPAPVRIVNVRTIEDLERAIATARTGDAILLADGTYPLRRMLDVRTPDVTIRSATGNPDRVIVKGGGMTGDQAGVAFSISAAGVTVADMTIRDVGYHAVQVRGEAGASRFTLHNARLLDAGQQLLKASLASNGQYADDALIACSEFSYTTSAPSDYTNAMSVLGVKGWTIRDNRISRIRGPESAGWKAGPAILVWTGSEGTIVERNVISDSFRGIALGLGAPGPLARDAGAGFDHRGGLISQNIIVNLNRWADEAIEINAAGGVRIEHNTVLVEGSMPWSISVRFRPSSADVRNNLTNRIVQRRDGGAATSQGNVTGASRAWFVDAPHGDLHLSDAAGAAVDAGVPIAGLSLDFDRKPRVSGKLPDAGAFERRPR